MQDQVGIDSVYHLRPNYQLNGFDGYFLLQTNPRNKHSVHTGGLQCLTINSEKWCQNKSKVCNVTQMIIVTLVQCGDIQTNPGPVNSINKKKRTYKIRFPCVRCQLGIRIRPVKCINCHNFTF